MKQEHYELKLENLRNEIVRNKKKFHFRNEDETRSTKANKHTKVYCKRNKM